VGVLLSRELAGRVVAITGASSGIGAATAQACARNGMRVGLFARREVRLEKLAKQIREQGGEAETVVGNVRDREAVAGFVTAVTRRWGSLDAIIANAGFGIVAPVATTPPDEVREIFDVNVLGTVWAIQAAWPVFEVQRQGHVIIVSSVLAQHGLPANAVYSATKAAQSVMADGLRVEGEAVGIDVSVVYPVGTDTEFFEAIRNSTGSRKRVSAGGPRGPRQSAEQVADSIVDCLKHPRFEVYPYRAARLVPWADALSPKLVAKMLRFPEYYRRQVGIADEAKPKPEGGA
jgi:NADP-dependent 3-hydroxy acid dehydrogenase YdfG